MGSSNRHKYLQNQTGSAKADVIVKLVLVFFISLLSFSIGTFVGKKFSDNQHKLAKYEPTHEVDSKHGSETAKGAHMGEGAGNSDSPTMTDAEVAKLAEEFVNQSQADSNESLTEAAGLKPNIIDSSETETHEGTHQEEKPKVEPLAKTKNLVITNPAQERNPSSLPRKNTEAKAVTTSAMPSSMVPSAAGKFTVQIAAYPTESEAEKLAGELKSKGFSAFYVATRKKDAKSGDEKTWYRVSVGLFATANEADTYLKDLKSRGKIVNGFVQTISN